MARTSPLNCLSCRNSYLLLGFGSFGSFDFFGGSGEHLALSFRDSCDGFGGSSVYGGFGHDGYALKLDPPFPTS